MKLGISDFNKAYEVISKIIQPTPLVYNEWLSKHYGCKVYLKLENMLPIGSFKMRGATYKISKLNKTQKTNGVLAVSAGNHAQGVAWAAHYFGIKATIIMPKGSPLTKIQNTESLGAKVILHGEHIEDCFKHAEELLKKSKLTFIHPFHDPDVILGQATVAYELVEQCKDIHYIFSSIGGGGLVSGIGSVIKNKKLKTKLIAGQASGASSMAVSLQKKKLTQVKGADTFADGIRVRIANPEMFDLLKEVVDEAHVMDDNRIAWGVLQLLEKAKVVAEGAGALPLAVFDSLYQKDPKRFKNKNIVLVICGGNIDVNLLERIIDRGLVESNRKVHLTISIKDKPGSLHHITGIIKKVGANILQVMHDRDLVEVGLSGTNVQFILETKGQKHFEELCREIKKDFPTAKFIH